jgi:hypothetical protein
MAELFVRGALVEYGTDLPLPLNIVAFQFNPEQLERRFRMPGRAGGEGDPARQREPAQAGSPPVESFSITTFFSAAEYLANNEESTRLFGVGPQLAALEKMLYPVGGLYSGAKSAAVDAVAQLQNQGDANATRPIPREQVTRPIPREQVPRLLFVWGRSRVLPVEMHSISITEQEFDGLLNPVRAEVRIELEVASLPPDTNDIVGEGALKYTQTVKDSLAQLNIASSVDLILDVIPF